MNDGKQLAIMSEPELGTRDIVSDKAVGDLNWAKRIAKEYGIKVPKEVES